MKYIYPKKTSVDDLRINEIKNKFLITNKNNFNIYGILIDLKHIKIKKEYNNYIIILPDNNSLEYYDNYLNSLIIKYKKTVINGEKYNYFRIGRNKLLDSYYNLKNENIVIFINHVKKTGFFNIPIINIL